VPSGWKNVLNEAAERLATAHPSRIVFLIVAIGFKCLILLLGPKFSGCAFENLPLEE
jgi:hypothetical protein